jgi:sugar/nucleoside kinase (ribokinase family)
MIGLTMPTIAPKRVEVVSSHGAGDCFVGTLAAKIARGASLMQAAEFANAAGAAHVSGQGAIGSG